MRYLSIIHRHVFSGVIASCLGLSTAKWFGSGFWRRVSTSVEGVKGGAANLYMGLSRYPDGARAFAGYGRGLSFLLALVLGRLVLLGRASARWLFFIRLLIRAAQAVVAILGSRMCSGKRVVDFSSAMLGYCSHAFVGSRAEAVLERLARVSLLVRARWKLTVCAMPFEPRCIS